MSRTRVVNLNHSVYDVYIGRQGRGMSGTFGNPCRVGSKCPECGQYHDTGTSTLTCFERYFLRRVEQDSAFREAVLSLKGKRLGCFCFPQKRCHGTTIVNYLERHASQP